MNIDSLRDENGNLPFKDAPFEAATLVGLDFDHRSDEDWEEFTALFKAHPGWTLDVVSRYFGVTAAYAGRLVDMYLTNTLPILAKQFRVSIC